MRHDREKGHLLKCEKSFSVLDSPQAVGAGLRSLFSLIRIQSKPTGSPDIRAHTGQNIARDIGGGRSYTSTCVME
jgi:hypothetical protein